jgi:hypothetical protein
MMDSEKDLRIKLGLDTHEAKSNLGSFYQDFKDKLKDRIASQRM